ncbi:MAG: hypothetical protein JNG88_03890 [Phycisphaerales bacterium]|nr:hypothetical protein [Phycisphaerales bacterium]
MNRAKSKSGALLLEVVVSLAIMVAALGLIGAQLNGGLKMTAQAETTTRAAELSDRMLALLELDPQMSQRIFQERRSDGDFGTEFPGYLWRANVEKTDVDGLGLVTLEILYQNDSERPTDFDGAKVVRSLHLLKSDPGRIDLGKDFGVPAQALEAVGPQMSMIPGLDPTQFDPQALAALPPQELFAVLAQLLPILQQAGIVPPGMEIDPNMSPDQIAEMIQAMVEGQGGLPGMGDQGGEGDGAAGQLPGAGGAQPPRGRSQATPGRGRSGSSGVVATPRANRGVGANTQNSAGGSDASGGARNNTGTRTGSGGRGSGSGGSGTTLDDLRRMSPGSGNSGGNRGSNGNAGGNSGGTRGRSGNNGSGGNTGSGQPRYTIEDLMRMRDEANRSRGGR